MKHIFKTGLTVGMAAILSACASNKGGFDLNEVKPPKVENPNGPTQPQYEDIQTEPRKPDELAELQKPGLGFGIKSVRRNWWRATEDERLALNDSNKIQTISENLDPISHFSQELAQNSETKGDMSGIEYLGDSKDALAKKFKYIQLGYILNTNARFNKDKFFNEPDPAKRAVYSGPEGYLFYKGSNPASALPTGRSVHYSGIWDYVTDVHKNRDSTEGNRYSSFSYDAAGVKHTSEFEVDFDNKKLTGTLSRIPIVKPKEESYTIEAGIHGNRFRGSATAVKPNHKYFGKSATNSLEGGFFGPNAENLAGKFLTDDNSLFAVFGAQQTGEAAETTPAFDAEAFGYNRSDNNFTQHQLTQFGNAAQLVIDGETFSLLPFSDGMSANNKGRSISKLENYLLSSGEKLKIHVCCDNYNYLKFGRYFLGDGYRNATLFLLGERTPLSEIPTVGAVRYQGFWDGGIISRNGSAWDTYADDSTAVFNVDFGNKTLFGVLNSDNRFVLEINGKLQQNGFSGTATTAAGGFNIDPKGAGSDKTVHLNAVVKGGFYGPNAAELGGTIFQNETSKDKISAVFGAKQQQLKEPKANP